MAKFTKEQIAQFVALKGFTLISCENYQNLSSEITVKCANDHVLTIPYLAFRKDSFKCALCEKNFLNIKSHDKVPPKTGYRVIALDQSSQKTGLSIWDDGKLVYYMVIQIEGEPYDRLRQFYEFLNKIIIPVMKPDCLAFEDIQLQDGNVKTFKLLSMVLGICITVAKVHKIEHHVILNTVWQKEFQIGSGDRNKQKTSVMKRVSEFYGLNVTDDAADAILLGRYIAEIKRREQTHIF